MEPLEDRPNDLMSVLRLDSIRNRILVLALLATLIPAFSTAILSFQRTRRALTETLEAELQRAGSQTARELDLWEKERTYDLRVFVGSFEVIENLPRISSGGVAGAEALTRLTNYLSQVRTRVPDYAELLVTDPAGLPVASTRPDGQPVPIPGDWLPTLELGDPVLGDPRLDGSSGVVTQIAVPIFAADGAFLGSLAGTLTFSAVSDLLAGFVPGEGGRIELVTESGLGIASSADDSSLDQASEPGTFSALTAAGGATMEYLDADVEMVGLLTPIPRLGWSVLVQVPTDEAYARITQLRRTTTLLVSVLLLFVGLAAYFIGLLIVRPLDRLTAGAAAVAEGDLSVDLPVTGRDEVAMLTKVFNGMVGQLRGSLKQLDEANETLREQYAELQQVSITDALTSLFIRRHVMAEFDKEIGRAARYERTLAVLMLDVDKFKQYNDSWGHQAGDEVLQGMGVVLKDATREADILGRYGGEEFIVLLPECDLQGAIATAERIRTRLAREVFDGRQVTVSIGAAEFPTHGDTPRDLIGAADVALYQAKETGRDRVVAAGARARDGDEKPTAATPAAKRRSATKGGSETKKAAARKKPAARKANKKKPAAKKVADKKSSAGKKEAATKKAAPKKKA